MSGEINIKTGSVGSCVVIAIYDRNDSVGGLAHAMLPHRRGKKEEKMTDFKSGNTSAKYADEAVENLVRGIKAKGGDEKKLVAKLVGGASMFKKLTGDKHGIGAQNIESAREKLQSMGIEIDNEDTGGSSGKIVEFHVKNGMVQVNTTL